MRIKHSIINISAGIGSQIVITLLSFISRTVFITHLGVEYLGINGLFGGLLGMLSLAEAGIGSAIIYSLYKPVANKDEEKIKTLMRFYKNAYMIIALVILVLGLSLMPFLNSFTEDSSVDNIYIIYSIFLLNTVSSYLFSHKISFLKVCQKEYIVTSVYTVSGILTTCLRLGILYYTQNFILYLLIEFVTTIMSSLLLATVVNKNYSFLKNKTVAKLDFETKTSITKNVKALVLHKIGGHAVFGTDNLLIASFVSVSAVGLYSNYYMLINICRTFIDQIFQNITHSVGNLIAEEDAGKIHSIFKVVMLCNFWIYSLAIIILYNVIEPFISVWIGNEFIMAKSVLIILMLNLYVSGMRRSINIVKTTSGIFYEDRYAPIMEAIINLGVSIVLVRYLGITGIFIGTLISTLAVPFWTAPYHVYKKVFKKPLFQYFFIWICFLGIGFFTIMLTSKICELLTVNGVLLLIYKICISIVAPNLIYMCFFYKTKEFQYLRRVIENLFINRVKKIFKSITKAKAFRY